MNISSGLCAHFRLGVLKWPGQIAVHSAKRPVAKYTHTAGRGGEKELRGISGKRRIMRDLKSQTRFSEGLVSAVFANFNRFLALIESSFRVFSLNRNQNDGYLDGKKGAFRSLSAKARRISAIDRSAIERLTLPVTKLKKIVHARFVPRFSYPRCSLLCLSSREIRKATIRKAIFRNSHFQPLFLPLSLSPLPPPNQNQYPSFQLVPDDKRNSFLEPSQFDFASKSKQAIGGMLKT